MFHLEKGYADYIFVNRISSGLPESWYSTHIKSMKLGISVRRMGKND